jgi:competence protein ComEA
MSNLKDYFYFGRKDRIGIIVLVAVISILWMVPYIYNSFIKQESSFTIDSQKFIAYNEIVNSKNNDVLNQNYSAEGADNNLADLNFTNFDANVVTAEDLVQMGVKIKLASNYIKFRNIVGGYKSLNQIKKIYGMDSITYEAIASYASFSNITFNEIDKPKYQKNKFEEKVFEKTVRTKYEPKVIDINIADSAMFESLRGIGPSLASRIIKYRNKLGGFIHINQIGEVFGMPDSTFQKAKPQLTIINTNITKININTADFNILSKHPYIGFQMAKTIVNYRKQHGAYENIEALLQIKTIHIDQLERPKPYLICQ